MNPFQKLPGFTRAAPGWEQAIWQRLPKLAVYGTLLPLLLAGVLHWLAPAQAPLDAENAALLLWDYLLLGLVLLHWTLLLTLALGCFIVRVMKGPAYVADAYALPQTADQSPAVP